jgi:hypothetical protein
MAAVVVEDGIHDTFSAIFSSYFVDDATFMGNRKSIKHYGE